MRADARARLWLITLAACGRVADRDPPTPDLAAHEYRAELVDIAGFGVWEQGWYAGHHLPGYSVLFPLAAALLTPAARRRGLRGDRRMVLREAGPRLVGGRRRDRGARSGSRPAWSRRSSAGSWRSRPAWRRRSARLLAARDGRLWLAALLGALTTLTSPVVAAFLVLACAAWWLGAETATANGKSLRERAAARPRAPLVLAAGAIVPGLLIVLAFPQGGSQPFAFSSFFWSFVAALGLAALVPARERVLRTGALLYAGALLAGVVIDTPLGGNLVRLAAVFGGPLAIGALWERRRQLAIAVLAIPLLYWQWLAPVRSVIRGAGDPSSELSYHAPLIAELDRRSRAEGPFRTEIPFTANHWEARYVPPRHPLARGWERQLDVKLNGLFYDDGPLSGPRLRRWLDEHAVRYVALPGVELDPAGREEGALVRAGRVPGLREVWRGGDWRLFRVAGDEPLVGAPARVTQLGVDELTLRTPRPATVDLRVRFTPYLALVRGRGCVSEAPGGWTRVRLDDAGDVAARNPLHTGPDPRLLAALLDLVGSGR